METSGSKPPLVTLLLCWSQFHPKQLTELGLHKLIVNSTGAVWCSLIIAKVVAAMLRQNVKHSLALHKSRKEMT